MSSKQSGTGTNNNKLLPAASAICLTGFVCLLLLWYNGASQLRVQKYQYSRLPSVPILPKLPRLSCAEDGPRETFAIIASALPESSFNAGYSFMVPLTVLAWRRIGIQSFVIFVGRYVT